MSASAAAALEPFFAPRAIAVVGASRNLNSISGKPLYYLKKHGYAGRLYPVNPRYDEIDGLPCFPSLAEVPGPVDLAIVIVAAGRVLDVLAQCAGRGVPFAAVISSGFAETGEAGRRLQEEAKALCARTGLRISGPNSQGLLNLHGRVAAAFSSALDLPRLLPGTLGFISQSGAFGFSTFCLGQAAGIGFSHVVSTGNEADLTWLDFLDYMIADPRTTAIAAYVEAVQDGRRFVRLAGEARAAGKPVVVLKVGRTAVGRRAAAPHTAALTGADAVFDAACRQHGVLRARDVADIFDLARVFAPGWRRAAGNRVGILTTSGGAGVMAADEGVEAGLEVPPLAPATRDAIAGHVPAFGSAQNPVDVTAEVLGRPEGFRESLRLLLADDGIDMLAVVLTMVTGATGERVARDLIEVSRGTAKPVAVSWSVSEDLAGAALAHLREAGIPLFPTPVRAMRALKGLAAFSRHAAADAAAPAPAAAAAAPERRREALALLRHADGPNEHEAKRLLELYGIPITRERLVDGPDAAVAAAEAIGYPVAVKVVARRIRHKTEAGAVRLGLADAAAVREAAAEVLAKARRHDPEAAIDGVLVQEMVGGGTEMIAGVVRDPQFGPTLMAGGGGVFVELLRDASFRVAPVDPAGAAAMIDELKSAPALAGARGQAPRDRAAFGLALCRLGELAAELEDAVEEIDVNPLIVLPEGRGVRAVDALIVPRSGRGV